MPPHQPVPITATSTCSTLVSPLLRHRTPAQASGAAHTRCGAEKDHSLNRVKRTGARRPAAGVVGARPPVAWRATAAQSGCRPLSSMTWVHLAVSASIYVLKSSGDLLATAITPLLRMRA